MKTKTIVSLYALAITLGAGVLVTKLIQNAEQDSPTAFSRGYKPFESLSPGEISEIHLKGANQASTIKTVDGKWVLSERANYPADQATLESLIRKMQDLSISQSLEAGASFDPRFGMDESSDDPKLHGTVVSLKNSDGAEVARLKIGKEISNAEEQDPMAAMMGGGAPSAGAYIRLASDPKSVYIINDPLSEAKPHPKEWLVKDFISVSNILSISLSPLGQLNQVEWKVTRPNATADFTLQGAIPAGKELNSSSLNTLKNTLAYANFEDIISTEAAKGLQGAAQSRRAIITTSEGFTYTLEFTPKDAAGTENYLMTVAVSARLITERRKVEGETEDASKLADEGFKKILIEQQEKLRFEQSLTGKVFEVTSYTLQALLKGRNDFLQDKTPTQASGTAQSLPQGFPQGGAVTSPPFQFPNQ